eukprot:758166-Hanusia_phi.AAC.1
MREVRERRERDGKFRDMMRGGQETQHLLIEEQAIAELQAVTSLLSRSERRKAREHATSFTGR